MNHTEWWSVILDVMTAFGTFGATVIALSVALPDITRHLDAVFMWDATTDYRPTLLVQNRSSRIAVIDSVEVIYDRIQVSKIVFSERNLLHDYAIIEAGATVRVPVDPTWLTIEKPPDVRKKRTLKIVLRPRFGAKHTSKQKYSYDELVGLFFGYGLFNL